MNRLILPCACALVALVAAVPALGTRTVKIPSRVTIASTGTVMHGHVKSPNHACVDGRKVKVKRVISGGMDEVMGFPSSWAYGYSPTRPSGRGKPNSAFGMVGMNGSAAYADIHSGVAVAVMRNRFTAGDFTTIERLDRLVEDELS